MEHSNINDLQQNLYDIVEDVFALFKENSILKSNQEIVFSNILREATYLQKNFLLFSSTNTLKENLLGGTSLSLIVKEGQIEALYQNLIVFEKLIVLGADIHLIQKKKAETIIEKSTRLRSMITNFPLSKIFTPSSTQTFTQKESLIEKFQRLQTTHEINSLQTIHKKD